MKISKELRVGILVTLSLAALIWGLNYLKGKDFFTTSSKYYVLYDNVDGLVRSNPVIMNGYRIGIINKIEFLPDNSGKLMVTMLINNDIFISKDAIANIFSSDFLGAKAMRIELGINKNPAKTGDTLTGILESSLTSRLQKEVGPLKGKVESLVVQLSVKLNNRLSKAITIEEQLNLSFDAHFDLVSIHPFYDGNGRASRLLMNFIQAYFNLPLAIVFKEQKASYFEALEESRNKEDLQYFRNFMLSQYMGFLTREIDLYQKMNDKPSKGGGYSMVF